MDRGGGYLFGMPAPFPPRVDPPLAPLMPPSAPCFTRRDGTGMVTVVVVLLLVSSRARTYNTRVRPTPGVVSVKLWKFAIVLARVGGGGGQGMY